MSTRFYRCPCCGTAHRVKEDDSIDGLLSRQDENLNLSERASYAWEKAPAVQGLDGRWRAQPSAPIDLDDPEARAWLDAQAERARRFLGWYDGLE